ncbi:MAG: efflux RND transporter periplasmic adaptor subunit [Planctomycetes bacterium]|nr:efflux RND transporter periplasmic adaptor subunit [Planctomycetota bacterium]
MLSPRRAASIRIHPDLLWSLAFAIGLASCERPGEVEAQAPREVPPPPVVVFAVEARDVDLLREYVARTEADDSVEIRARVEAVLQEMSFEEGRRVQKDQVLYRLDQRTYAANREAAQAQLARAKADLELAEKQVSVRVAEADVEQARAQQKKAEQDVARLEPLAAKQAVPQQDLDTARAALEVAVATVKAKEAVLTNAQIVEDVAKKQAAAAVSSAEAALALAELDVEYCTLKSPMDGLIGRSEVSVGNLVGRGETTLLATLDSVDPMLVLFAIGEAELLSLQARRTPGSERTELEMELSLADGSLHPQKGRFRTAERALGLETGTMQVIAEFPNPEGKLRPGQFGRVRTSTETKKGVLLVPQRAVIEQQGARAVLVVGADNKVVMRSIVTAERWNEFFVVTEGVAAGDRVVIEGQLKARPGMTVKIVDGKAQTPAGS